MTSAAVCVLPAHTHPAAPAMNKSLLKVLLPMHTRAEHACVTALEWRPSAHLEEMMRVLLCQHTTELIKQCHPVVHYSVYFSFYYCSLFLGICCLMRLTYCCVRRVFSSLKPAANFVNCESAILFVYPYVRWICCHRPLRLQKFFFFWISHLRLHHMALWRHHDIILLEING